MVKFKLKKGLDLRLKGKAEETVKDIIAPKNADGSVPQAVEGCVYAVFPADFYGFKPRLVVKEGCEVKVGDTLFINKEAEEVKVVSPVSGTVKSIVRGERRKLLRGLWPMASSRARNTPASI